jgi:hypothetical protein
MHSMAMHSLKDRVRVEHACGSRGNQEQLCQPIELENERAQAFTDTYSVRFGAIAFCRSHVRKDKHGAPEAPCTCVA